MAVSGPNVGGAAGVTGSAKNSTTPGFLGGAGGGEKPVGLNAKNEKGASTLGAAENAAANTAIGQNEDNLDGARDGEENVNTINYTGTGRDDDDDENEGHNFFSNHKGPVVGIIGLIFALAIFFGGSQLMQPFGFVEQLRTSFNSMQTSVATRSNVLFRYQLGKDVKNPVKSKFFSNDVFKISEKQRSRLAKNGIEIEEQGGKNIMKYTGSDGQVKYVVPDSNDIPNMKNILGDVEITDFNTAFKSDTEFFSAYKGGSLTWRGSITNWFESLTTRFLSENRLTRNLFQDFRSKVSENGGDVRKTTIDLIARGTDEVSANSGKVYSRDDSDFETDENGDVRTDENGDPIVKEKGSKKVRIDTDDSDSITMIPLRGKTEAEIGDAVQTHMKNSTKADTGGGISGIVQTGSSIVCGIADAIGVGTMLVTGAEALQTIHLVTSYLEAIDKVKAGAGDDSPINELANSLNTKKTNKHYDFDYSGVSSVNDSKGGFSDDEIAKLEANKDKMSIAESTTTKSAAESSGFLSLFSGGKVDPNDASVRSFNFSGNIKRILGGLGVSMTAFSTCAIVKLGANVAGVVEGIAEWGPCVVGLLGAILTFGASTSLCAGAIGGTAIKIAEMAVVAGAISAVVALLVPYIAKVLTRDLITDLAGEDLGNALVSGANLYMGNNHRYNGGSLGNKNTYLQFAMAQQEVIAEDAKYERINKNPFDATSQYTFLGTLLKQVMNYVGKGSLMSVITSTNSVLGSSIASIMPTASAIDANNKLIDNYEEVCPFLASIGAVGDAYCNPYAVSDVSTMGIDPSEVVDKISENLIISTEDGKNVGCDSGADDYSQCTSADISSTGGIRIKPNSKLAKYIKYCDRRSSAFGIMDQNISNDIAKFSDVRSNIGSINSVANGAIGAIPVYGDLVDVVQNGQKLANIGFIKGSSCVAGNDLKEGEKVSGDIGQNGNGTDGYSGNEVDIATPSWDTAKYYQRFIEDQSLMESMGIIEKSAVTAFIEEDQEANPLDYSYEGILARYSGLTTDQVIAFFDELEYYEYLADYDPSERYVFGQEIKPAGGEELKFDNDQKVAQYILLNTIEFADVRNRSFVV